jgi:predicted PurR-regulated permease PerM
LQSSTKPTTTASKPRSDVQQPAEFADGNTMPAPAATAGPHRPVRPRTSASRRSLQIGFAVIAVALSMGILYLMRDVLGAFVLGALIAFLITPYVDSLTEWGLPRPLAVLLIFACLIGLIVGLVSAIAPLLSQEVTSLQRQVPLIAATAQERLNQLQGRQLNFAGFTIDLTKPIDAASTHLNDFLLGQFGNALSIGITALTTALQVILMLIVAFLIATDSHATSRMLRQLVPTDYQTDFDEVWTETKKMLLAYMKGQLVIAGMIGISSGIAVAVLGLPYALALGLLAGITSLVPYLGPFLGAIPAVLIGLAESPEKALLVAVAYLLISNVILNFIFPKVMGSAVRLPAILVIVAFLAGFSLAGILGMFVAIPVAATIRIIYDHVHPRLFEPPAPPEAAAETTA